MKFLLSFPVQITLLILDMLLNTCSITFVYTPDMQLLAFAIQDLVLIFSFVLLSITFFQTIVFQAGFVGILWRRFWPVLVTSPTYLLLSVILHIWSLFLRWTVSSLRFQWPLLYHVCFFIHRLLCPVHYYVYKRTMLSITDEQLYDKEWISQEIEKRNSLR